MKRIRDYGAIPLLLVVVVVTSSSARAQLPEVWVVNEAARDVTVIDTNLEAVDGVPIPLGPPMAPQPYGIAFSSLVGRAGDFAFVTQGANVVTIDAATRTVVRTTDIGALLGLALTLKGADAALPEIFLDGGLPALRSLLHVTANVDVGGGLFQPTFIVLDQFVLAGLAPMGTSPLVFSSSLLPAGSDLQAMEVTTLGVTEGDVVQIAWYTVRDTPIAGTHAIKAIRVGGPEILGDPWVVQDVIDRPMPASTLAPDSVHVGAPHDRDFVLLPEGPTGEVSNLSLGGSCTLGGIPRAATITGPAPPSHDVFVTLLDPNSPTTDEVAVLNWFSCRTERFATGANPVDVVTLGTVFWKQAYIANRNADTLTLLRDDPAGITTGTIALAPPGPGCTKCPRSLAVREDDTSICRAVDLEVDLDVMDDPVFSWGTLGCAVAVPFETWGCPPNDDCDVQCVSDQGMPEACVGGVLEGEPCVTDADCVVTCIPDGDSGICAEGPFPFLFCSTDDDCTCPFVACSGGNWECMGSVSFESSEAFTVAPDDS